MTDLRDYTVRARLFSPKSTLFNLPPRAPLSTTTTTMTSSREERFQTQESPSNPGRSMEPRRCSRGDPIGGVVPVTGYTPLQWSHGVAAVETSPTPPRRPWCSWAFNGATALQPWRHPCPSDRWPGLTHPSMEPRRCSRGDPPPGCAPPPYPPRSFNGATALQPWRPPSPPLNHRHHLRPSMEPRRCSRGDLDRPGFDGDS